MSSLRAKSTFPYSVSSWFEAGHIGAQQTLPDKLWATERKGPRSSGGPTLLPPSQGSRFWGTLTSCGARLKSSSIGERRYSVLFPQTLQDVFTCTGMHTIASHTALANSASRCSLLFLFRRRPTGPGFGRRSWGLRTWDTPRGMPVSFWSPPLSASSQRAAVPGR